MNAIKTWYNRERKILGMAVACGLIFTFCLGWMTKAYSDTAQEEIANGVIRFHVLANSDGPEDQALKLKVRDGILEKFQDGLSDSHSREETKIFLHDNLEAIKACAADIIHDNGYDYSVDVTLSRDFFPTKTYGDVTFPPGIYEALRVVIGDGDGKNWWCVMFPPLCYVDVTKGQTPPAAKEELKQAVGPKKFELLSDTNREKNVTVKVKFKIVEWWQNLFHKSDSPQPVKKTEDGYVLKQR